MQLGVINTNFIDRHCKIKQMHVGIMDLLTDEGVLLTEQERIIDYFANAYKKKFHATETWIYPKLFLTLP